MAKRTISIGMRISYERLEALCTACGTMATEFTPAEEHEYLLRTHLVEMKDKMNKMLERGQERYTLHFTAVQALAFKQVWQICGRYQDRYTQIIVNTLLKKLDDMERTGAQAA